MIQKNRLAMLQINLMYSVRI